MARPIFLIVEDSEFDVELLVGWLERFKAEVICVSNAADAYRIGLARQVDALFVNLKLGQNRIAGIEVVRRFRASNSCLPIFVVTGADDDRLQLMAYRAGATGFFSKNFHHADTIAIENMIAMQLAAVEKGQKSMKHWRTNLAGACTATGAALFGGPVALSTVKFEAPPEMLVFCIWGGLIMMVFGVFFGHWFAADRKQLEDHLEACKPPHGKNNK